MQVTMLTWRCPCNAVIRNPRVGITSTRFLVAVWLCPKCKKNVSCAVPFEELEQDANKLASTDFTDEDNNFLGEMGIGGEE